MIDLKQRALEAARKLCRELENEVNDTPLSVDTVAASMLEFAADSAWDFVVRNGVAGEYRRTARELREGKP